MDSILDHLKPLGRKWYIPAIILLLVALLRACGPNYQLEEKLASIGGPSGLRKACEEVWPDPKDRVEGNGDVFTYDELPEHCALRLLRPQLVYVTSDQSAMLYQIQTSGGFYHAGYLVTVNASDPVKINYVPGLSPSYKIRSVGDGVFLYEE